MEYACICWVCSCLWQCIQFVAVISVDFLVPTCRIWTKNTTPMCHWCWWTHSTLMRTRTRFCRSTPKSTSKFTLSTSQSRLLAKSVLCSAVRPVRRQCSTHCTLACMRPSFPWWPRPIYFVSMSRTRQNVVYSLMKPSANHYWCRK